MKPLGLSRRQRAALSEYVDRLVETLSNKLEAVILFGSKATGGFRPGSDTDVAVILRGEKSPDLRVAIVEPSFAPIAKYGVDISPIIISGPGFRTGSPLVKRIKKGIKLWNRGRNLLAAA